MPPWKKTAGISGKLWPDWEEDEEARLGLLGGTFDPIHYGHLLMSEWARDEFDLKRVVFIPAGAPPHKRGQRFPRTERRERWKMLLLATQNNMFFRVWDYELKKDGLCYTHATLAYLQQELPKAKLFFLMGQDSLAEIFSWKSPTEILQNYDIIVGKRGGNPGSLIDEVINKVPNAKIHSLEMPDITISSSLIRQRVLRNKSINYLTPPEIVRYISAHNLYKKEKGCL